MDLITCKGSYKTRNRSYFSSSYIPAPDPLILKFDVFPLLLWAIDTGNLKFRTMKPRYEEIKFHLLSDPIQSVGPTKDSICSLLSVVC